MNFGIVGSICTILPGHTHTHNFRAERQVLQPPRRGFAMFSLSGGNSWPNSAQRDPQEINRM